MHMCRAKSGDITITMEPWAFRSESNKHGSTKKHIDFPLPDGSAIQSVVSSCYALYCVTLLFSKRYT